MPTETRIVAPSFPQNRVRFADGSQHEVPTGWALLEPGDATLTKRVKGAGPTWTVKTKKGRRMFSLGIWAPAETIERERAALVAERETPAYQKRLAAGRKRAAAKEVEYGVEFEEAIMRFLRFADRYRALADQMSKAIAAHATPVGSGTVARTKRISVEERAEAATIAWMRHALSNYDNMKIARVKGERRRVRAEINAGSRKLLDAYRAGRDVPASRSIERAFS